MENIPTDLHSLKRVQLQRLCKKAKIKANGKTVDLIAQLQEYYSKYQDESGEKIEEPENHNEKENIVLCEDVEFVSSPKKQETENEEIREPETLETEIQIDEETTKEVVEDNVEKEESEDVAIEEANESEEPETVQPEIQIDEETTKEVVEDNVEKEESEINETEVLETVEPEIQIKETTAENTEEQVEKEDVVIEVNDSKKPGTLETEIQIDGETTKKVVEDNAEKESEDVLIEEINETEIQIDGESTNEVVGEQEEDVVIEEIREPGIEETTEENKETVFSDANIFDNLQDIEQIPDETNLKQDVTIEETTVEVPKNTEVQDVEMEDVEMEEQEESPQETESTRKLELLSSSEQEKILSTPVKILDSENSRASQIQENRKEKQKKLVTSINKDKTEINKAKINKVSGVNRPQKTKGNTSAQKPKGHPVGFVPNFAKIHERQFNQMKALGERKDSKIPTPSKNTPAGTHSYDPKKNADTPTKLQIPSENLLGSNKKEENNGIENQDPVDSVPKMKVPIPVDMMKRKNKFSAPTVSSTQKVREFSAQKLTPARPKKQPTPKPLTPATALVPIKSLEHVDSAKKKLNYETPSFS